jgi:hypothetical protein
MKNRWLAVGIILLLLVSIVPSIHGEPRSGTMEDSLSTQEDYIMNT